MRVPEQVEVQSKEVYKKNMPITPNRKSSMGGFSLRNFTFCREMMPAASIAEARRPLFHVEVRGAISERESSPVTTGRRSVLNFLLFSALALLRRSRTRERAHMGAAVRKNVAVREPGKPACWYPTNVAAFIAIGPGVT